MTAPTHSPSSPLSTSSEGLDQHTHAVGMPSHENDYFSSSEATEKPASESISEQPKNAVDLVDFDSSTPTFASDPNDNARDTGLVSRAVDLVDFGSETTKNDQSDPSSTIPDALRLLALVGTDDDPYKVGGPWAYANKPKNGGRTFMITQNLEHPSTGQTLITTEQVEKGVAKKGVQQYAWILHDKDVYTADDAAKDSAHVQGSPKAPHVHIAIYRPSFATLGQVARSFGVPPQCVQNKPDSSFLDLVEYLTHEHPNQQQAGKHLYDDSEVHASQEWDWRSDLEAHKEKRLAKGLGGALKQRRKEAALKVAGGEWSLDYVRQHDLELWSAPGVMSHLKSLRADYLASLAPPAEVVNFYIFGPGGVGKDLLAHALARSLNPTAEKPFFTVGGSNVSFEDYDGEEVIIWSDFRASTMLDACRRDRGLLFRVLGPYRDASEKVIVNVKGSHTQLVNRVNIVTGPDDYKTFLDGLAGEYAFTNRMGEKVVHTSENKDQAYRRFPLIIPVQEGEFSIYVNLGFLNGTREYQQYECHERLRHNLELVNRRCQALTDAAERKSVIRQVESRTVAPILEQCSRLPGSNDGSVSADDILSEFATAGQAIVEPEPTPEEIAAKEQREADEQAQVAEQLRKARMEEERQAAEIKAAEDRRKADEQARKQREQEVLAAKKSELAAAGQLDLIPKVRIRYVGGELQAYVDDEPQSPWSID